MQKNTSRRLRKPLVYILAGLILALCISTLYLFTQTNKNHPPIETALPSEVPSDFSSSTPSPTSTPTPTPEVLQKNIFTLPFEEFDFSTLSNDSMDDFASSFSLNTADADAYAQMAYNQIHVDVNAAGANPDSVMIYRDGIPLTSGASYLIYMGGNSTNGKTIKVAIVDANTGATAFSQDVALPSGGNFYELPFTYQGATTYNGSLRFYLGQGEGYSADLKDIRVVSLSPQEAVHVNQLGYLPLASKRCTFPYNAGDIFDVMDASTNTVVLSGPIRGARQDEATGETNFYGDFSSLTTPGTYYIRTQIGVTSPTFEIKEDVYASLVKDSIKMFSLQRCGMALNESWAGGLNHSECHTAQAKIYGVEEYRDVTGGWHDAGDYGRFVETGTKAVNDLLFAYLYNPSIYGDDTNGPDSNNGIPDILDEARYELDWLFKMQNGDGGVYNTVITDNVANNVLPNEDEQRLNLLYVESTSTSDFFVTMAIASIAYEEIDPEYAKKCFDAAIKAKKYVGSLSHHLEYPNPSDINGGLYLDDDDLDSQFSGNLALWAKTQDKKYLEDAKAFFYLLPERTCAQGVTWKGNGGYGRYLFLVNEEAKKVDKEFYSEMYASIEQEANNLMHMADGNAYQASIYEYPWASNTDIANHGIILSMAYDVTGNTNYLQVAQEQLNYLLGKNTLGMSYVTGYGHRYPHNIHSRMSLVSGQEIPGALVGGPDEHRDDKVTAEIGWDVPAAKVYRDTFESYSTNEIAIIYNSSLVHLLARLYR
ncbi:MAG: glycoside hydrolase family 9 protein [Solobacterium sp.]|nr:glycoside hydrolase family 9 protein [Solobacterium sp.]